MIYKLPTFIAPHTSYQIISLSHHSIQEVGGDLHTSRPKPRRFQVQTRLKDCYYLRLSYSCSQHGSESSPFTWSGNPLPGLDIKPPPPGLPWPRIVGDYLASIPSMGKHSRSQSRPPPRFNMKSIKLGLVL